jgi:membrane protease YdiL (CAAX protease family)
MAPRLASLPRYLAATAVTVFCIASQYFLPQLLPALRPAYSNLFSDAVIVYGIPIVAFLLLVGVEPLRNWSDGNRKATVEGLRWYALLTLLALFLSLIVLSVLTSFDPSAVQTLNTPTPVVKVAQANPWFWAGISFGIGALEEGIFRGWIFGYWLKRRPQDWKWHAAWTSVLFASVHVYYALTYGIVFIVPALVLVADGLAFAIAMRESGGNLVAISLLHGWNDATVFIALALPALGIGLHYAPVLLGGAIALVLYLRMKGASEPLRPI